MGDSQSLQNKNGITEGVIWKQLLSFFFPIVLGTFFQQLYNTVDAVIVGKFVGTEALSAVGGSTAALINLLVGFFVGLSSGASVIISQYYGAGRRQETSDAVHTSMALSIAGGFALTVFGFLCSNWALRIMDTPESIMDQSMLYLRIYFGGMVFQMIYNIGSGILRAVGDSRRPLYFLIVCCIVNLVLDLLFVLVFKWGVMGAALATVLSQAVSAVLVMFSLMRTDEMYHLDLRKIRFHMEPLKGTISIGLPCGMQSVMYSVSNIIIQRVINQFDVDAIAAWTVFGKVDGIYWMIMAAFGVSVTTFAGQNFGAKKYDRIHKSVRVCLLMAFATAGIMSVIVLGCGQYIYQIFTSDTGVIEVGVRMMSVIAPFYFAYVATEVLSGAVRGAGDGFVPMVITGFGICVLRIVWVLTVVPKHHSIETAILSFPITWIITSVMFVIYYLQGGWLRRQIKKSEANKA